MNGVKPYTLFLATYYDFPSCHKHRFALFYIGSNLFMYASPFINPVLYGLVFRLLDNLSDVLEIKIV